MKFTKKEVYELVKQIPEGHFFTYSIISKKLGSPRGQQGVAKCLKRHDCDLNTSDNTIIVSDNVYCHRVINSDFSLGGYSFDELGDKSEAKRKRLEEEGIRFEKRGGK
ncbi:12503_t:CDS:1 [Cetraspora pellucida]|uniref:12503_t:CDS:1 n=1 Tax=Cetraspora pellucida TaxID=1433469 RepID=A0ACA9QB11_9GLOM|nr:12503_t:CDS:1 [Cetraspora pellucida]